MKRMIKITTCIFRAPFKEKYASAERAASDHIPMVVMDQAGMRSCSDSAKPTTQKAIDSVCLKYRGRPMAHPTSIPSEREII